MSSLPRSGANQATLTLVVNRSASAIASAKRKPNVVPPNAQSVSAQIIVGSNASGSVASAQCAAFGTASTVTLTLTAPYGTDTLVVQSWSGACNAAATAGTGAVFSSFTGSGTVNSPTADASTIFNGSKPIELAPLVQFVELGPIWPAVLTNTEQLVGSGKIQTVIPIGTSTQNSPAREIYIAGGPGGGFEVSTSAGIYKTTNAGASWTSLGAGSGLVDTRVNDLYIIPGSSPSSDIVLAATTYGGVYRSTDGGATWANTRSLPGATSFAAYNGAIYLADSVGVEISSDDGATWSTALPISASNSFATGARALAAGAGVLIAGDVNGSVYVYNGMTWSGPVNAAPTAYGCDEFIGFSYPGAIHSLLVDSSSARTMWATAWSCTPAGDVSQELYLSQDGGSTWTHPTTSAPTNNLNGGTPPGWYGAQMIANSAVTPNLIYVGGEFEQWSAQPGSPPTFIPVAGQMSVEVLSNSTYGDIRGVTVVPNGSGGDACYIASDQGLFYQGTCGANGALPTLLSAGLSTNFLYGFGVGGAAGSETLLTTLQDFGPAASSNGGGTWTSSFGGLDGPLLGEGGDAEVSPANARDCIILQPGYLGASYSTDGCKTFTGTYGSGAILNAQSATYDRSTPNRVYFATGASGLLVSNDNGQSAYPINTSDTLDGISEIRTDPTNGNNLFAVVSTSGATQTQQAPLEKVLYSNDAGVSWKTSGGLGEGAYSLVLAVDPSNVKHVVAVGGNPDLIVYQSNDGAATFSVVSNVGVLARVGRMMQSERSRLPFVLRFAPPPPLQHSRTLPRSLHELRSDQSIAPQFARSLEFNPTAPAGEQPLLALATAFGLFASTDGGTTWLELDGGSNATTISRNFTKVEWANGYLFVSTEGQGLLRSSQPLQ